MEPAVVGRIMSFIFLPIGVASLVVLWKRKRWLAIVIFLILLFLAAVGRAIATS